MQPLFYRNMKKNLTPAKAYKAVKRLAKIKGVPVSTYVVERGMSKSAFSRWQNKNSGSISVDLALKLGLM